MSKKPSPAALARSSVAQEPAPPAATLSEAQRLAATILEVLAGLRAPPAAAELLKISLPRYYQLEARALNGLVAALAPRPRGKQVSLENRVKQLEKELAAAQRASARQEALVRVTQRSLGLAALAKPQPVPAKNGSRRKPRKPMVRALKAARNLRSQAEASGGGTSPADTVQPTIPAGVAQETRL